MNYMLCPHKKTKNKLVAWAQDCKGKHSQGFKFVECCATCGARIKHGRDARHSSL